MTKTEYLNRFDVNNIPYRPVNLDGSSIKVKDMSKSQLAAYRKWLKFMKLPD